MGIRVDAYNVGGLARRAFLTRMSALTAASALGFARTARAEPPPETTRIRMVTAPTICTAPVLLAENMLRLEGFTDIKYVDTKNSIGPNLVAEGAADFTQWGLFGSIPVLDAGSNIVLLSGVHPGCQELFAHEPVRAVRDLKGKRIAVSALGNEDHIAIASILAYVGIDPRKEVTWVEGGIIDNPGPTPPAMKMFIAGEVDALMAFEPDPQELRRQKIGRAIVRMVEDKPWSQYFCCILAGNRDFVRTHPIATKRVLRAILKSADICAKEPERVARYIADKGYAARYEAALETVKLLPYRRWRDANPEDTLRFHALRLHEVGMIKNTPQKLIAQGTDWRFLNELKRELKA
jgi:NitT/TauT family transport system substrate-binding protein